MSIVPAIDGFRRLASGAANTVPVYREISADLDTPVSAFLKLHRQGQGFLLESVEGGERWGRYSVLGTEPVATLRACEGRLVSAARDGSQEILAGDPLEGLKRLLASVRPARVEGLTRFGGGFVGYLAYDLVRYVESLPLSTEDDLKIADLAGLVADSFILFDNVTHSMKVVCLARLAEHGSTEQAYREAVGSVDETVRLLRTERTPLPAGPATAFEKPRSNIEPAEYREAVERARTYIRDGDVIQVVLSQRFSQPLASHPFAIYRALRRINPSPYMFYLDLADEVVIGASPEMMVKVEGREVSVRPIAGTIRRGRSPEENERLIAQMLGDPKERAEHIMLLDLGRNDVGRVAEIGTVRVAEQMNVERYSHVNHIVSHVSGLLRGDADRFDAFRATFPAGTLTGAPKVRAMEIIEELERTRRGVYGGAVGYVGFDGNLDTCIAIRTVVVKQGVAYMQVGAGIVADSDPASEQNECEAKARGILLALERAAEVEAA